MHLRAQVQDASVCAGSGCTCVCRFGMQVRAQVRDASACAGSGCKCVRRFRMHVRAQVRDARACAGSECTCVRKFGMQVRAQVWDASACAGSGCKYVCRFGMQVCAQVRGLGWSGLGSPAVAVALVGSPTGAVDDDNVESKHQADLASSKLGHKLPCLCRSLPPLCFPAAGGTKHRRFPALATDTGRA